MLLGCTRSSSVSAQTGLPVQRSADGIQEAGALNQLAEGGVVRPCHHPAAGREVLGGLKPRANDGDPALPRESGKASSESSTACVER
ncbi:MAG: hypothetical protein MZV70_18100 [Desulfobacterales bacterium]|nr:hypothetical protein [Desulfobacterales bacterium]